MIENNFLKRVTKSVTLGRKSQLYDRSIMHPERDWLIGVFVSMIILIIVGWWSIVTYEDLREPVDETANNFSVESTYKDGLVKDALAKYKNRTDQYNNLKAELTKRSPVIVEEVIEKEDALEVVEQIETTNETEPDDQSQIQNEEVIGLSI